MESCCDQRPLPLHMTHRFRSTELLHYITLALSMTLPLRMNLRLGDTEMAQPFITTDPRKPVLAHHLITRFEDMMRPMATAMETLKMPKLLRKLNLLQRAHGTSYANLFCQALRPLCQSTSLHAQRFASSVDGLLSHGVSHRVSLNAVLQAHCLSRHWACFS